LLAKQYGINFSLIPSAFKKKKKEDDPSGQDDHPRQLTDGSAGSELPE
jgi:hypothetical protein